MRKPCRIAASAALFPSADEPLLRFLPSGAPAGRSGQLLRMDRLCGLALVAADRAVAALPSRAWESAGAAVVVGSEYGCHKTDEEYFRGVLAGQPSPRLFAYTLPSSPVGEISIQHGVLGPGLTVVGSRAAGLEALCEALSLLRSGQASSCLVIGCDVAAPAVPERSEDAGLCDGAAALLLEAGESGDAGGGVVLAASATCYPDAPAAALAAALAEVGGGRPRLLCDAGTRALVPAGLGEVHLFESPLCGAAAALAALAWLGDGAAEGEWAVVAADPSGQAAAVLWRRAS